MSVVKFEATVDNGSIIIPLKFRNKIKGKVEVSVQFENKVSDSKSRTQDEMYDRKGERDKNFINWLMKNPLKVDKSIPFLTRDEIYDRKL